MPALKDAYTGSYATALRGIEPGQIAHFAQESMQPDGITTLSSPFDFQTTLEKIQAAIDAQDDTVKFGKLDFQARASAVGVENKAHHAHPVRWAGPWCKSHEQCTNAGSGCLLSKIPGLAG